MQQILTVCRFSQLDWKSKKIYSIFSAHRDYFTNNFRIYSSNKHINYSHKILFLNMKDWTINTFFFFKLILDFSGNFGLTKVILSNNYAVMAGTKHDYIIE